MESGRVTVDVERSDGPGKSAWIVKVNGKAVGKYFTIRGVGKRLQALIDAHPDATINGGGESLWTCT